MLRADSYSAGVRISFSSAYSFPHFSLPASNAWESPPHPTYLDKISCSCGVARRFPASICFKVRIAARLFWYFVFWPPVPRLSSVIRKLRRSRSLRSFSLSSSVTSFWKATSKGRPTSYTCTVSEGTSFSCGAAGFPASCALDGKDARIWRSSV